MKKFIGGTLLGMVLSAGTLMYAQPDRDWHPRLRRAIESLRDARAYLQEAPHDFGGHRTAAIRATDEAIRQLEFAQGYRERERR
jgi:hypothetical protein